MDDWGGPNAVGPGDTATASIYFSPGQYVVGCYIESADGKLHVQRGMLGAFQVYAAIDTTRVTHEDALVTLTDYRVTLSAGRLATGTRRIRVHNAATQGHDLEILQILPGQSDEDALRWFEHPGREVPTARAIGGLVAIHPEQDAVVTATFAPGTYLLLCWVPDVKGVPHFRRGMSTPVTIQRED